LPLFAPPTHPLDLLRAQAGGSSGASRSAGGWLNIPHYRFRPMLASTQNAVQTLMRFGQQVLQFMEQRDRGQLEKLQQGHLMELSTFATEIQQQAIAQLKAAKEGLDKSKAVITAREKYYKDMQSAGLVDLEIAADSLGLIGRAFGGAASLASTAAWFARGMVSAGASTGAAGPLPFATVNTESGDYGAPLAGTAVMVGGVGSITDAVSDSLRVAAFHTRRIEEWQFQESQALAEIESIDQQILAQGHAIASAEASLRQAKKAAEQAQTIYSFHMTRTTSVELYRWLVSQMATHYYQAHDAVVGMCLSTQASWQYEMGDYDTTFVRPNVWMDIYHGLMAGESIALDLLRMESAFLHRHERRLELTKTISLRQLFDAHHKEDQSKDDWVTALGTFDTSGILDFEFTQRMFDLDYPGHYCRQITTVDVTFPAILSAYQDTHVILTQLSSTTAVKPVVASLDYLYEPNAARTPLDVKLNLRNSQQIAVSNAVQDPGLHTPPDERYLPFEGTGAQSKWRLELPMGKDHTQKVLIQSLTDIIIRVHYLAFAGNTTYTQAVIEKLKPKRANAQLLPPQDQAVSS